MSCVYSLPQQEIVINYRDFPGGPVADSGYGGGACSILGQATKIPHAVHCGQIK